MGFTQTVRVVGGAVLTGALLVTAAPAASADQARDGEWAISAYSMNKVWPISTGQGITVAVIDSGVRSTHVDLTGQVLKGTDFVHGGDGSTDYSNDGHGTGVASIIAAHGHGSNNQDGIIGLAPGSKILPIGVDPENGNDGEDIDRGIRYAVDHGAKIINISLGGLGGPTPDEQAAVAYAEAHNVIIVAAAGNEGATSIDYPGAEPGVVSVAAVGQDGHVWSQSNSGAGLVLAAPGVNIVRAGNGSNSEDYQGSGTSYAAPFVSATAALVWAKYPDLTAGQVINRLIKSAKIDPSATSGKDPDPQFGYGIVRPYQALTENIPAGPAAGPLAQATASSNPSGAVGSTGSSSSSAASSSSSSSSTGLIIAAVAIVAVLALILLVVLLVRRGKKNNNGGGGGFGPGGAGGGGQQYPPAYPQYGQPQQQAYPPQAPAPGGYRPPTGNGEQSVYQQNQNNPYAGGQQQPPYGGQPR